jgi:hypothetical protein
MQANTRVIQVNANQANTNPVNTHIVQANAHVSVHTAVDKGQGVFAARAFEPGETLITGRRQRLLAGRTIHSLQMETDIHVELDAPARLINHSCMPNTGVRNNRYGGYDFVALRPIAAAEEVTFDYETTEYLSIAVPQCRCGAKECRGRTRGYKYLPAEVRARYGEFIAGYLRRAHQELQVVPSGGPSGARLITTQAYRCGDFICPLPCHSVVEEPTYLTIQIGHRRHIDQIDVLGFMNHSCAPSTILDVEARSVIAARDLAPGEELTFFYPSTEWEMARPFECCCGAAECLGWIAGAGEMPREQRNRYVINPHIEALCADSRVLVLH